MKTGKVIEFFAIYILFLIVVTRCLQTIEGIQDLIVCGVAGNAGNSVEKRTTVLIDLCGRSRNRVLRVGA